MIAVKVARDNEADALNVDSAGKEGFTRSKGLNLGIISCRACGEESRLKQDRSRWRGYVEKVECLQEARLSIDLRANERLPRCSGDRTKDRSCVATKGADTNEINECPAEIDLAAGLRGGSPHALALRLATNRVKVHVDC
jgi:hypothetical protein